MQTTVASGAAHAHAATTLKTVLKLLDIVHLNSIKTHVDWEATRARPYTVRKAIRTCLPQGNSQKPFNGSSVQVCRARQCAEWRAA